MKWRSSLRADPRSFSPLFWESDADAQNYERIVWPESMKRLSHILSVEQAVSRISHGATQKQESPGPTGVQDVLLSVAATAQQLGVCTPTVYTLCARGQLPHIRILNAIRIPEADLKAFVAARRIATEHQ